MITKNATTAAGLGSPLFSFRGCSPKKNWTCRELELDPSPPSWNPNQDPINGWQLAPAWLHWHAHAEAGTCAGRYPRRAGITRCAQGTSGPWVHLGLVQRRYAGAKVTPFFAWVWVWLCLGPWESPLSLVQVPLRKRSTVHCRERHRGRKQPSLGAVGRGRGPFLFPHVLFYFSRI